MDVIRDIETEYVRLDLPDFLPGDTINVHVRIIEGNKERIQIFRGVVISKKGGVYNGSFTIRKISHGVGVERIFLINSPSIHKIEIMVKGRVRRAKIYYLRNFNKDL